MKLGKLILPPRPGESLTLEQLVEIIRKRDEEIRRVVNRNATNMSTKSSAYVGMS